MSVSGLPNGMAPLKVNGVTGSQLYEGWKLSKFQFENYLVAANLGTETKDDRKVALLLHFLGPEVVPIYQSFGLDRVTARLTDVISKFEGYFAPKKNLAIERHKFLSRRQLNNESLEAFLTDLKNLASSCELSSLADSLTKDVFILGLNEENVYIKERLLQESEEKKIDDIMALAQTIQMSRNENSVNVNQADVMKVFQKRQRQKPSSSHYSQNSSQNTNYTSQRNTNYSSSKSKCGKCGQIHRFSCPALNAICNFCSKKGHYAVMCQNKRNVKVVNCQDQEDGSNVSNEIFIGQVQSNGKAWYVPMQLNHHVIEVCLDTGAEANVMSYNTFCMIGLSPSIIKPVSTKLTSYNHVIIPVRGQCLLYCTINNLCLPVRFFVTEGSQKTLLGLESCEKFNLIQRINAVQSQANFGAYQSYVNKYSEIFEGLGCLPGECHITLKENAIPHIAPPRRVPFKLMDPYKAELERMVKLNVIEKVTEPSLWVNSVALVSKPDGSLRLCLDPQPLNKEILRAHYPLPTLEDARSKLAGSSFFSKLDASTAFWSVKLDNESTDLCTFQTPFGRYKFLRMPYGISLAPEKFHQKLTELLSDISGTFVYLDDVLIFAKSKSEHDKILVQVLNRVREINLKLNKNKCQFGVNKITFLGQVFESSGMKPENSKIEAIQNMSVPKCVKDVQRFLGMINYLASYVPNLSEKCLNLRKLLRKENLFCWEKAHEKEFNDLKSLICTAPVLNFFEVNKPIVLNVDSSKDAVGACLLQSKKPIAYASKSLTDSQIRWAQIEKELFAIWFGCSKFHQYVFGQIITVETDHKPLITLFKKSLADIPVRLQRLMMKLQMYELHVVYKSGKEMYVSDTLSRAALKEKCHEFDANLDEELAIHTNMFFKSLNASDKKLEEIENVTKVDPVLSQVVIYVQNGWPSHKSKVSKIAIPFFMYRNDLHMVNGILFKGSAIVIPTTLQSQLLKDAHVSHMGYNKTKNFVKNVFFWPSLFDDLKFTIQHCQVCQKYMPSNSKEPLVPHEVPRYPWEKVGVDFFDFDKHKYLVIVDYYSKFFETVLLNNSTSQTVICHMKSIFSRQGVPAQLISDGGPPFSSKELRDFYLSWNIEHLCSSPYYPKSNGLAEQTVKLIKNTLYKCKENGTDPYLAMLHLRNSCSDGKETPAKLLCARNLRTNLPTAKSELKTSPVSYQKFKTMNENRIESMKSYYDKSAKQLPIFMLGDKVFFQKKPHDVWLPAIVTKLPAELKSYRAYEIKTLDGQVFIRNRIYLRKRYQENDSHKCHNKKVPVQAKVSEPKACIHTRLFIRGDSPVVLIERNDESFLTADESGN